MTTVATDTEHGGRMKSRKWAKSFPAGAPQDDWEWFDIKDAGSFKSDFNGCHDLDGGAQCDLCSTWHRYIHFLRHDDVPDTLLKVGADCAWYLTGGLNCYRIEEDFIRSERHWQREDEKRRRLEAEEIERQQRKAKEIVRLQQEADKLAATRLKRIEEVRQGAWQAIREIGLAWHLGWHRSINDNLTRSIECTGEYFGAGCTIIGKPDGAPREKRRFKYVLNLPKSGTLWGPRWCGTENEAVQSAYCALRDYMMNLVRRESIETWIWSAWQTYIETGVHP